MDGLSEGHFEALPCEFNRDSGWPILGAAGFEPVRVVAVDEDWSALRFRRVQHIKVMTRSSSNAVSKAGKLKASSAGRASGAVRSKR